MVEKLNKKLWFFALVGLVALSLWPLGKRFLTPGFSIQKQDLTVLFKESILRITPTQGDVLEVATLDSFDTLTRRDTKSLFDDLLYLGTTVSEIKVKVTYRYHVLLSDAWNSSFENGTLQIIAPEVRPSLPPAIHTDQMEKRSEAGWMRFNARENLDKLEATLTPTLSAMAMTPAKTSLIREAARQSLSKFIHSWVLTQKEWSDYPVKNLKVLFANEADTRNIQE
ncbi:MAG: hypothetical protein R3A80_04695 [Bdellovibrionota bacterium]